MSISRILFLETVLRGARNDEGNLASKALPIRSAKATFDVALKPLICNDLKLLILPYISYRQSVISEAHFFQLLSQSALADRATNYSRCGARDRPRIQIDIASGHTLARET